jgi:uncharacterized surface protein with fasciclin (FAS1) repeats
LPVIPSSTTEIVPPTTARDDEAALAEVPPDNLKKIMDDPALARNVALFHVIPGKYTDEDLLSRS